MNFVIISITVIVVIALLAWIIMVNRKEKKRLENQLNKDYPIHEKHNESADPEDLKGG
jgi:FtsZ-interacting cell division protein ZipA